MVVDEEEAYLLEALAMLLACSWKARERGMRVMDQSLRTLVERIRMDRVDPREMAEAREAEADLETEAMKAEVDIMKDLWNHDPRKGEYPRIARRRWTERPLGSPPGAEGRKAEPLCRRLKSQTGRIWERMTLPAKVQL